MTGRAAWLSIAALCAGVVLLQPISQPVGAYFLDRLEMGTDARQQWLGLEQGTPPALLVLGDSRVTSDISSRRLGADLGFRVGKIGVAGETPDFLSALTTRVLELKARPHAILYAISEYQLNAGYSNDPTPDLWQISSPVDWTFVQSALAVDQQRERLIRGWVLPGFANYRIIARGIRCSVLAPSSSCVSPPPDPDQDRPDRTVMTSEVRDGVFGAYRQNFIRDYRISDREVEQVKSALARFQGAGIKVGIVILPQDGIADLNPPGYAAFLDQARAIAGADLPMIDLHAGVPPDPMLWADPAHLNLDGCIQLELELAANLRSIGWEFD